MTRQRPVLVVLAILGLFAAGFLSMRLLERIAHAQGAAAVLDAGVDTPAPTPAVHDPAADPTGFAHDLVAAFKSGEWILLAVLVLLALDAAALAGAKRWSKGWLHRQAPYLATVGAALTTTATSMIATGRFDWRIPVAAILAAALAYARPKSTTEQAGPAVTS